jgi:hypothetical protein
MKRLDKPVRRVVEFTQRTGFRPLVVTLHPSGLIMFREFGRRRVYALPVMAAYRFAVLAEKASAGSFKLRVKKRRTT